MLSKLKGIIPPITTPFDANGEIDERAFRAQVKFLLTKGVHGVCVGGSTGEGHTLAIDEFKRLIAACAEELNGKVPLVAGIIANSTRDAIARARAIETLDVAALQITPVHYLFKPDDAATVGHFKTLTGFAILAGSLALWPRFIEARFGGLLDMAERLIATGTVSSMPAADGARSHRHE